MDRYLAQLDFDPMGEDAYAGEVLPDTRLAWREYARQARKFAEKADDTRVNERIGQMLKLAEVYRKFGGLQNIALAEEIRAAAAQTVQATGYGGRIRSTYLEANVAEVIAAIERNVAGERNEVRPIFLQHLLETARRSYARLTGQSASDLPEVAAAGG
jgi:hypothetical protein